MLMTCVVFNFILSVAFFFFQLTFNSSVHILRFSVQYSRFSFRFRGTHPSWIKYSSQRKFFFNFVKLFHYDQFPRLPRNFLSQNEVPMSCRLSVRLSCVVGTSHDSCSFIFSCSWKVNDSEWQRRKWLCSMISKSFSFLRRRFFRSARRCRPERASECSLETIEPIFKAIAVSFTSSKRENNGQNHISRSRERYQRPQNSFAFSMVLCCVSPSFYVIYNSCEVFLRSASFLLPWMIKKGARRRRSSYGDFRGRWLQLEPLSRAV